MVCLSVCWSRVRAVLKWLNRSRCRLGCRLVGLEGPLEALCGGQDPSTGMDNYGGHAWSFPELLMVDTHTHLFNGPLSGTTRVSRYQKGKTNLDFTEARDNEWQWHQLGRMQVCILLQADNHANTPPLFFTGRMPFLPPKQQRQSTEGMYTTAICFH